MDELRALGAQVEIVTADVAHEADVRRLLDAVPDTARLRMVFHCAGVIDDAALPNQNWERFRRVLVPKVAGAWNLHRATQHMALDAFVLFSSVASSVGSAGQANYACANAFLDLLAHYRRSRGLPALSINWGPWNAGMAAASAHARVGGVAALTPAQALAALERLLLTHAPQVTIANIDWSELAGAGAPPLFAEVAVRRDPKPARTADLPERLRAARPAARAEMLADHVRAEVARVLGTDHLSDAQEALTFSEMGMSSLMVMELRNSLQEALRCTLPSTAMFNAPTVQLLAGYIGRELLGIHDQNAEAVHPMEDLGGADRIASLTEDEVADLLIQTIERIE